MSETDLELYSIVGKMLREVRENKGYSLEAGADYLSIAPKSLQRYECGERKIKIGTIKSLCTFYGIDYDNFIKEAKSRFTGNIAITPRTSLTKKDEKDIEKILDSTREQLLSQEGLMFDGNPATPEAIDSILSAMQIGMEMAKKKNKEKYTPKKYKKD